MDADRDPNPAPDDGIDLAPPPGRLRSASTRAAGMGEAAAKRVAELRTTNALVDTALEAGETDRRRAGSLLAGGIAFRLFLWLLPAALLVSGVAGLVRSSGASDPDRVARQLGLGASVASTVDQATQQSSQGSGALIVIGAALMLYTSMSLVRALRIAHVLAWEEAFRRRPRLLRDGAIISVALLGSVTAASGLSYLRNNHESLLVLLSLVPFVINGAIWLGLSYLLPHGSAGWRALLPGAVLFSVGTALLQIATVFYFVPRLTTAPSLYGPLGTAATLLAWLYVIARITVASAFLNATRWRRSQAG